MVNFISVPMVLSFNKIPWIAPFKFRMSSKIFSSSVSIDLDDIAKVPVNPSFALRKSHHGEPKG